MKIIRKIAVVTGKSVLGLVLLALMAPMMLIVVIVVAPFLLARLFYDECLEPMADGFTNLVRSNYVKLCEAAFNIKGD